MNQLLDELISDIYDEHPQPRITRNTPDDYTSRLISQLNLKRSCRARRSPTRHPVCSRPVNREVQP